MDRTPVFRVNESVNLFEFRYWTLENRLGTPTTSAPLPPRYIKVTRAGIGSESNVIVAR
jgi:hypothetical protein